MKFASALENEGVSQATLSVAVRARPLSREERLAGARTIATTVDERCVVVTDPDAPRPSSPGAFSAAGRAQKTRVVAGGARRQERRYVFDGAFDGEASNEEVYDGVAATLVRGVLAGVNATVFAYGATGSGKTHTMVGEADDPGLMILSLRDVFRGIERERRENDSAFEVTCSYAEVYNELIFDLLADSRNASRSGGSGTTSSTPLELREDPTRGPVVAGLTHVSVTRESEIFALLAEGNARRKTEETGANATSSRSHAVLEVWVTKREKNRYDAAFASAKLRLVDLAGAERASETNNRGAQLRDGANINKSLLSLANCINALGRRAKKGFVFVPFRDSKLTRILKDGLCGNSRTAMVATVSGSSAQYEHTVNTLKYADRAKAIKTHVRENRGTVRTHIAEYRRVIDSLREERAALKAEVERLRSGAGKAEANARPSPTAETAANATARAFAPASSRSSSGSSAKSDDPFADVNELLLAAAAALPEGDELRAEAEALAARARRAAAAGLGKPSPGARRAGETHPGSKGSKNDFGGNIVDELRYATRVLDETVGLNGATSETAKAESARTTTREAGAGDDGGSETEAADASRTEDANGVETRVEGREDAPRALEPSAALSRVPEREAANRANVARGWASGARAERDAKKRREETGPGPGPAMPKTRPSGAIGRPGALHRKTASRLIESAVKPSPYAQSARVAGAAGTPRGAAPRRRLEKSSLKSFSGAKGFVRAAAARDEAGGEGSRGSTRPDETRRKTRATGPCFRACVGIASSRRFS